MHIISTTATTTGETIASNIAQQLEQHGWEYNELATATGLPWSTLVAYRSDASDMTAYELTLVAEALEVEVVDLVTAAAPTSYAVTGQCVEHAWCVLAAGGEHDDFHLSETITLAPPAEGAPVGVHAHVVLDRGHGERPQLVLDGRTASGSFDVELDARGASTLLLALIEERGTGPLTPAGEKLLQLLGDTLDGRVTA